MSDVFLRGSAIVRFSVYPLQRTGAVSFSKAEAMDVRCMLRSISINQVTHVLPSLLAINTDK